MRIIKNINYKRVSFPFLFSVCPVPIHPHRQPNTHFPPSLFLNGVWPIIYCSTLCFLIYLRDYSIEGCKSLFFLQLLWFYGYAILYITSSLLISIWLVFFAVTMCSFFSFLNFSDRLILFHRCQKLYSESYLINNWAIKLDDTVLGEEHLVKCFFRISEALPNNMH